MMMEQIKMDLEFKGITTIESKEVKIIEGAFGEGKKCILAKDVALQHEVTTPDINKLINRNHDRFTENDLIDLKNCQSSNDQQLINMGFTQMQISKADNIFLLSERGYQKLVSMMDNSNEKKWLVMDKIIDDYFSMREIIKSDEQKKKDLIYKLYEGGINSVDAHKQLLEIEVKEVTKPLLETIEVQEPKVEAFDDFINSDGLITIDEASRYLKVGKVKLLKELRSFGILRTDQYKNYKNVTCAGKNHNMPYQQYMKYFHVKVLPAKNGICHKKMFVTPEGLAYINKRLKF